MEEELLTTKSELDILKKEIIEKTTELNLEKAKLENSIKNEHVILNNTFIKFNFNNFIFKEFKIKT